jgi:TPR repeat protein
VRKPAAEHTLREQVSGPGFFSKSSALAKLALAGCGILLVVAVLFWASSRRRSGERSAGTQQQEVKREVSNPPALGKSESNQPQGGPRNNEVNTGRPQSSAPVQPSPTQGQAARKEEQSVTSIAPQPGLVKKERTDELSSAKNLLKSSRFSEALPLFRQAAATGNIEAQYYLGLAYDRGWGVAQDFIEARRWYEQSASAGNGAAMAGLGGLYVYGYGVPKDYQKARELFEKGAAAGDGRAMSNLGALYDSGRGVPQDYQETKDWYEKGAATGDGRAMGNLGYMYESGHGVPQDIQKAKEWYEKGVAAGDERGKVSPKALNGEK